ncbi:Cysteine and glycine-rich protein 2 [Sarcoptes scabiei]|nr:Cysteine and glycine-rich protein 2 [Sarcoptes scabiei]
MMSSGSGSAATVVAITPTITNNLNNTSSSSLYHNGQNNDEYTDKFSSSSSGYDTISSSSTSSATSLSSSITIISTKNSASKISPSQSILDDDNVSSNEKRQLTQISKAKPLKSLLKQKIDPNQDFIKSHNKKVKFSETMQVFCYEMPDNQMPQLIALKQDVANLKEFQAFMYDPPAEYQDLLTFEPPPDYRDFIANSLNVFHDEVAFDFIDDDDDDDDGQVDCCENQNLKSVKNSSLSLSNEDGCDSKWQSMILDNNLDSLEEEQIIGVLKEDDILQAIGSQVALPVTSETVTNENEIAEMSNQNGQNLCEENLSSADFPVHHLSSFYLEAEGHEIEDDETCCLDSSPNGSMQDLASDSSITSQDTIILINQNKTFHEPISAHHLQNQSNSRILPQNQALQQQEKSSPDSSSNTNSTVNENIYENVQNSSLSSNISSDNSSLQESNQQTSTENEVLYENTGKLLIANCLVNDRSNHPASSPTSSSVSSASQSSCSSVANHIKNFENRLSISSSSEDSRCSSEGEQITASSITLQNVLINSKQKRPSLNQNNPIYEHRNSSESQKPHQVYNRNSNVNSTMVDAPCHVANVNNMHQINQHSTSEMNQSTQPSQQHRKTISIIDDSLGDCSAESKQNYHQRIPTNNLVPLQCFTIMEANRTSSSSSLSSASTVSSSSGSSAIVVPLSVSITQSSQSSSFTSTSMKSKISPLPSSDNRSISSNMIDQNQVAANRLDLLTMPKDTNLAMNNAASINLMRDSHTLYNHANVSVKQQIKPSQGFANVQSSHVCIVNNSIRPGQVIYRYPCALIQSGPNGLSTIRPVQYIVQAGSNVQTPLNINNINSKLVVSGNAMGVDNNNRSNQVNSNNLNTIPKTGSQIVQGAHVILPNGSQHSLGSSSQPLPLKRIILPQGTTAVLAPRVMQLHPQHNKNHHPPSHQNFVQQHECQSEIMAAYSTISSNVNLRPVIRQQMPVVNNEIYQNATQFPNPSEIRRRDGLYAYPHVLIKKSVNDPQTQSSQTNISNEIGLSKSDDQQSDEKDELEAFVLQEQKRTERIKKRYSYTEDDDPTFGFARRPSVRGIRSKSNNSPETTVQQITTATLPTKGNQVILADPSQIAAIRQTIAKTNSPIFVDKSNLIAIAKNSNLDPTKVQQQSPNQKIIHITPRCDVSGGSGVGGDYKQIVSIVKQINELNLNAQLQQKLQKQSPQIQNSVGNSSTATISTNSQQYLQHHLHVMINGTNTIHLMKSQTLPRHVFSQPNKLSPIADSSQSSQLRPTTSQHTNPEVIRVIDAQFLQNGVSCLTLPRDQIKQIYNLQKNVQQIDSKCVAKNAFNSHPHQQQRSQSASQNSGDDRSTISSLNSHSINVNNFSSSSNDSGISMSLATITGKIETEPSQ